MISDKAEAVFTIENVRLWNGRKDPYLYTAKAVLNAGGETVDEVSARFGCRSFTFDPEKGFILNGRKSLKILLSFRNTHQTSDERQITFI